MERSRRRRDLPYPPRLHIVSSINLPRAMHDGGGARLEPNFYIRLKRAGASRPAATAGSQISASRRGVISALASAMDGLAAAISSACLKLQRLIRAYSGNRHAL